MTKFFTAIVGVFVVLMMFIWALVTVLGGAEILWWIFTGDFFHFVSTGAEIAQVW